MKSISKALIIILLLSAQIAGAELLIKQIDGTVLVTDGKTCLAWTREGVPGAEGKWTATTPVIAPTNWTTVEQARTTYNWPQDPKKCFTWTVKANTRRLDGARPINNILTKKSTGKYIPKGSPCGGHANPAYRQYWRLVPSGMAVCEQL